MIRLRASYIAIAAWAFLGTCALRPTCGQSDPMPPKVTAAQVQFNRDIRPIMSDTCFLCHGPGTQEAGLRLDVPEQAAQPTDTGAVPIVPGNADESEIIRRVFSTDPSEQMPPPESNKQLTDQQKQLLRQWVEQGARYQQHWSFEPLTPIAIPWDVPADVQLHNPVDAFIAARLKHEAWTMSAEADRATLIRRVSFTLTGLPPTLAEVEQFLSDTSPDAYERMVDRYLSSPRFGEEMARHWLDVARYADTHGLHLDNERQMWAYRDWVVRAFNSDMPFDQFTIEQLAGDLLENPTVDQLTATGFQRCNVTTGEGGSIEEEWIFRYAVDRASTTMEAWLGLTGGCAVCHDHKYDPITARDFYSLYAFFNSAADPALDGNALLTGPTAKLTRPWHVKELSQLDEQIAAARQSVDQMVASIDYQDPATVDSHPEPEVVEHVWFDDDFPAGGRVFASPGHATMYVTAADASLASGEKALKRTDAGLAQDVCEGLSLTLPAGAKLFAHVWLDANDPPRSIMLQYHKDGWLHRAVWGDYDAIAWGRAGTTERVHMGPLPEGGQWVRLELPAEQVGLAAGDQVTGFAFTQFGGTVLWDRAGVTGRLDAAGDPQRSLLAYWKQQTGTDTPNVAADIQALLKAGPEPRPADEQVQKLRNYYVAEVWKDRPAELVALRTRLQQLQQQRAALDSSIPSTFIYRDLAEPRPSFIMLRGAYNKPGDPVAPDTPGFLPPLRLDDPQRRPTRLDLAQWLVAPENPLTARVAANRIWQQVFGTGLVKTSFDFGSQGSPPTHPELLDWLALWLQEHDWSVKELTRMLVTSATFRQASHASADQWVQDPENLLYARGPRLRLAAEQIRDNALFVSGLLAQQMGGRGVRTYQPPNIWEPVGFVGSNTRDYVQDHGAALYRRSLYVFFKRTAPPPFMANFDAPSREAFCAVRDRSNTPLQALQLMNDVQHFEAARAFAERMLREGGSADEQRLEYGFQLLLAREPAVHEMDVLRQTLQAYRKRYEAAPADAEQAIRAGESPVDPQWPPAELAAYTLVANLLLNLDETLTRN